MNTIWTHRGETHLRKALGGVEAVEVMLRRRKKVMKRILLEHRKLEEMQNRERRKINRLERLEGCLVDSRRTHLLLLPLMLVQQDLVVKRPDRRNKSNRPGKTKISMHSVLDD